MPLSFLGNGKWRRKGDMVGFPNLAISLAPYEYVRKYHTEDAPFVFTWGSGDMQTIQGAEIGIPRLVIPLSFHRTDVKNHTTTLRLSLLGKGKGGSVRKCRVPSPSNFGTPLRVQKQKPYKTLLSDVLGRNGHWRQKGRRERVSTPSYFVNPLSVRGNTDAASTDPPFCTWQYGKRSQRRKKIGPLPPT